LTTNRASLRSDTRVEPPGGPWGVRSWRRRPQRPVSRQQTQTGARREHAKAPESSFICGPWRAPASVRVKWGGILVWWQRERHGHPRRTVEAHSWLEPK
jgi:hypothetical protein